MEKDPIGNDVRKARRARRIPEEDACVFCGEADPVVLERHHPAGRAHWEDGTVTLCVKCHRKATEGQMDAGVDFADTTNILERLVPAFRSLGSFFLQLGEQLLKWAEDLDRFIGWLDAYDPDWRDGDPP